MLLPNVSNDEGVEHVGDIGVACLVGSVGVGAGHTAFDRVAREGVGCVVQLVVKHELRQGEWEDGKLEGTPSEQRCEVAAHKEGVRTGNVQVVLFGGVQAVDGLLEPFAHLDFVDEHVVLGSLDILAFDMIAQSTIF